MYEQFIPIGLGAIQTLGGYLGLNRLQHSPVPTYTETPEMKAARMRAEQAAQFGFSPEEKAAYEQTQAGLSNQRYRRGLAVAGGNLAGAINAGVQYGDINAALKYAAQDAALKRNNVRYADTFAQNLQNLQNRNTDNAYNYRLRAEQALGQAVQAGLNNVSAGAMMALGARNNGNNSTGNSFTPNYKAIYNTSLPSAGGYNWGNWAGIGLPQQTE